MEKSSTSDPFFIRLQRYVEQGALPPPIAANLKDFYTNYRDELALHEIDTTFCVDLFTTYLELVVKQIANPYLFPHFHPLLRAPFDYYKFGLDFMRPLVDMQHSSVQGLAHLQEISQLLAKGENVILLANHQIEGDPLAISILLENLYPEIATNIIFVAGERVLTDPLAVPFSLGTNLLCIYSKRYIDFPPEKRLQKQRHNQKTMETMSQLLQQGGKCIYVAPAGGRDRANSLGEIEVAPFDPNSIEMFFLMAKKSKRPTHFYPLALSTYHLLPPPQTIQIELGERRTTKRGDIHLFFGPQINMLSFPGAAGANKQQLRQARSQFIWNLVKEQYNQIASAE